MCIILDTNSLANFKDQGEDMEPIWYWLRRKNGKIVYSDTDKFRNEWKQRGVTQFLKELLQDQGLSPSSFISIDRNQLMRQLQRRDKFRLVSAQDVQKKADELEQSGTLRSDDPHIIALAMLANVKVLVVQRLPDGPIGRRGRARGADPALQADFKDRNLVGGKVYITKGHSRLLTRDTCP